MNGADSFAVKPTREHVYRVVASTTSAGDQPGQACLVRSKSASKRPPTNAAARHARALIRSVFPAHERRGLDPAAQPAPQLPDRPSVRGCATPYGQVDLASRRVRIFRDAVYRVKVAGDGDHINGFSRLKTIDVTADRSGRRSAAPAATHVAARKVSASARHSLARTSRLEVARRRRDRDLPDNGLLRLGAEWNVELCNLLLIRRPELYERVYHGSAMSCRRMCETVV
jgi:hypothetical protein